jgi:hypothetical protein
MAEQGTGAKVIPENQAVGDKTDSSVTNQHPPRPGQADVRDEGPESKVAGQGMGQLTEADKDRLEAGE